MKTKNYIKDYLMKSVNELRKNIRQSTYRIQSLECQIIREKKKLNGTMTPHDHLWYLRDKLRQEIKISKIYKTELKEKEAIFKQIHKDTSSMTTMEVLEMNNPDLKVMGEFFGWLSGK